MATWLAKYDIREAGQEVNIAGEQHVVGEDTPNYVFLNEVPLDTQTMVVQTEDGVTTFTLITSGTPSSDQVRVYLTGRLAGALEFHASKNGTAIKVDYKGRGSNLFARDINRLQTEKLDRDGDLPMTGTLLSEMSAAGEVVAGRLASDTKYRVVLRHDGLLFGPGGSTEPDVELVRTGANLLELRSDVIITGDFEVQGTTTFLNTNELQVGDNIIVLNASYSGSNPTLNAGIELERGNLANARILWDEATDTWKIGLAGSEYTIWHAGNQGPGSGMNADLLDGQHASAFALASHNHDERYLRLTGGSVTGSLVIKQALWLDDYAGGTGNRMRTGYTADGSRFYIAPAPGGVPDSNKELSYDFAAARWVFDETPYVASHVIWHAGNFDPSAYMPRSGGTFTGSVTADSFQVGSHGSGLYRQSGLLTGEDVVLRTQQADQWQEVRLLDGGNTNVSGLLVRNSGDAGQTWNELLRVTGSEITYKGEKVWHAGNDGSGSGLDADKLDGLEGSAYARKASSEYITGEWRIYSNNSRQHSRASLRWHHDQAAVGQKEVSLFLEIGEEGPDALSRFVFRHSLGDGTWADFLKYHLATKNLELNGAELRLTGTALRFNGNPVWHAGNDGSGSGLDADTLDGKHASDFALANHTHDSGSISFSNIITLGSFVATGGVRVGDTSGPYLRWNNDEARWEVYRSFSSRWGEIWAASFRRSDGIEVSYDNHNHDDTYLKLTGGTISGSLTIDGGVGVPAAGTLVVRQRGDTASDGITLSNSAVSSFRMYVDANNLVHFTRGTEVDSAIRINVGRRVGIRSDPNSDYILTVGGGLLVSSGVVTITQRGDGAELLRFNTDRSWSFFQRNSDAHARLELRASATGKYFDIAASNGVKIATFGDSDGEARVYLAPEGGVVQIAGYTVWHAGNDGAGSGLDADLLDGQDGTFYRNASNINAGTLADARLSSAAQDAINKRHAQNSDAGTSGTLFGIGYGRTLPTSGGWGIYFGGTSQTGQPYWRLDLNTKEFHFFSVWDGNVSNSTWAPVRASTFYNAAGVEVAYANHNHDSTYLKLSGGSLTGRVMTPGSRGFLDGSSHHEALLLSAGVYYGGSGNPTTNSYYLGSAGPNNMGGVLAMLRSNGNTARGLYVYTAPSSTGKDEPATLTELFVVSENGISYKGNTIWHAGNDGAGSGLDADTLDGQHASAFVRKDARTDGYVWVRRNSTSPALYVTNQGTGNIAEFYSGSGDGTRRAYITNAGDFYAPAYYETSSRWLKQNIEDYNADALATLRSVRIRTFEFKNQPGVQRVGIIAEETDAVFTGPARGGFLLADSLAVTMRAVQQLAEENERLKKENTDLRKQVGDITTLVRSLVDRLAAMEARI